MSGDLGFLTPRPQLGRLCCSPASKDLLDSRYSPFSHDGNELKFTNTEITSSRKISLYLRGDARLLTTILLSTVKGVFLL